MMMVMVIFVIMMMMVKEGGGGESCCSEGEVGSLGLHLIVGCLMNEAIMLDKDGLIGYHLISGDVGVFVCQSVCLSVSFHDIDKAKSTNTLLVTFRQRLEEERRAFEAEEERRRKLVGTSIDTANIIIVTIIIISTIIVLRRRRRNGEGCWQLKKREEDLP